MTTDHHPDAASAIQSARQMIDAIGALLKPLQAQAEPAGCGGLCIALGACLDRLHGDIEAAAAALG